MPRSIRLEYKSCCCNLVSVLGWFILSSTHELMWMWEWELPLENVCALIEYGKKMERAFYISLLFFLPPFGSIVLKRATSKIAFFFDLLPLSEWNEHWKFLPLIITATKSLSLFSCTRVVWPAHTQLKVERKHWKSYLKIIWDHIALRHPDRLRDK